MLRTVTILFTLLCVLPSRVIADDGSNGLAPLLTKLLQSPGSSKADPEPIVQSIAARLRNQFDERLKDPEAYRQQALRECSAFPEGHVYPFAIPAMGYANLALGDPTQREHCAAQMRKLIDPLIASIVEAVAPPGGDLLRLDHYRDQGTRLATLNLTLACYALVSDDPRYRKLHDHVSDLLQQALAKNSGAPLASYPEYTWYFDTIMALASLELHDRAHGQSQSGKLMDQHFAWIREHATDAATGLPVAYEDGLPRGCDLSMQVCLLKQIGSPAAQRLYDAYVKHHWADLGLVAGFREWPMSEKPNVSGDIDSGPLILGIGPTATGVGVGATKAMSDASRFGILARQFQTLPDILRFMEQSGSKPFGDAVPIKSNYVTGFLYGDAVLFYAITWAPYPAATGKPTSKD